MCVCVNDNVLQHRTSPHTHTHTHSLYTLTPPPPEQQAPGDRPTVRQLLQHPFVAHATHPPRDWLTRVGEFCSQPHTLERPDVSATNTAAGGGGGNSQQTLPRWNFPGATVQGSMHHAATGTIRAEPPSARGDILGRGGEKRGDEHDGVYGKAGPPRNGTIITDHAVTTASGDTDGSVLGGSVGNRGLVDSALDGQHGTFREVPRSRPPLAGGGEREGGYGTVTSSFRGGQHMHGGTGVHHSNGRWWWFLLLAVVEHGIDRCVDHDVILPCC